MKFKKTEKYLMLLALITLSFAACKKYNSIGYTPGTGTPVISSVSTLSRTVVDTSILITTTYDTSGNVSTKIDSNKTHQSYIPLDSTTTTGEKQRYYVIHGSNLGSTTNVLFNGVNAYFNRALGNDKSIIINIPLSIPTLGDSAINKLTVVTTHGKANFNFTTLTPPPTIAGVTDFDFWQGSQLTLVGVGFASVSEVGLTGSSATATIVSQTDSKITLQFPQTTVNRANLIFSYTSAGNIVKVTSKEEFIDLDNAYTIFYKDNYQNTWFDNSWAHPSGVSTNASHSGAASIQASYPAGAWQIEGWAGWNSPTGGIPYDADYKYLTFWVKGGTVPHTLVLVGDKMAGGYGQVQNANAYAAQLIPVPANVWTFFKIPLGPPSTGNKNLLNFWANGTTAQQLGFFLQGMDGDVNEVMYFDEVAFVK